MITGVVEVDVSREPALFAEGADRRALAVLYRCPDGAVVRVHVGRRNSVSTDVVFILGEHLDRLRIEVVGSDPDAVRRFLEAVRPEVVAR